MTNRQKTDSRFDTAEASQVLSRAKPTRANPRVQSNTETLQDIAQAVWGDSRLWYLIADANGGIANTGLAAGQPLTLPTRANTVLNSYQTFKPYNQADAVGSTSPNLPLPSAGNSGGGGCGAIGTIVMVAIAVAVTVYTAGVLSGATDEIFSAGLAALEGGGTVAGAAVDGVLSAAGNAVGAAGFLGGAVADAAGSVVSQAVGNVAGIQQGFSWSAVALSAIGGGASASIAAAASGSTDGLADIFKGTSPAQIAARAVASNTIAQGVGMVTGLQNGYMHLPVSTTMSTNAWPRSHRRIARHFYLVSTHFVNKNRGSI